MYCIAIYLLQVKVGDRKEKVRFFHCFKRGVDRVFVDHPIFLEKVRVFLFFFWVIYSLFCFQIIQILNDDWTWRFGGKPEQKFMDLPQEMIIKTINYVLASSVRFY